MNDVSLSLQRVSFSLQWAIPTDDGGEHYGSVDFTNTGIQSYVWGFSTFNGYNFLGSWQAGAFLPRSPRLRVSSHSSPSTPAQRRILRRLRRQGVLA